MNAVMNVSREHITKTPGVCGGKACIAGTRIRVMDIAGWHDAGATPAEMIEMFPHITHADVHAALAYYFDNREEIAALFEADRMMDEYGETQPSKLKDFLAARSAAGALPSGA
jgi:uncharacterized protein (DUF433 family)